MHGRPRASVDCCVQFALSLRFSAPISYTLGDSARWRGPPAQCPLHIVQHPLITVCSLHLVCDFLGQYLTPSEIHALEGVHWWISADLRWHLLGVSETHLCTQADLEAQAQKTLLFRCSLAGQGEKCRFSWPKETGSSSNQSRREEMFPQQTEWWHLIGSAECKRKTAATSHGKIPTAWAHTSCTWKLMLSCFLPAGT